MEQQKQTWAIIDVGSNTIRLCVYAIGDISDKTSSVKQIITSKKTASLASYIDNGYMSKLGIDAAISAISELLQTVSYVECSQVYIFATAALRNCINSLEAVSSIEKAVGYPIQVLSGQEEAFYSLSGALQSIPASSGLFFDLGGGSTEIMVLEDGELAFCESIPQGTLSSWKMHVESVFPSASEIEAIRHEFNLNIAKLPFSLNETSFLCGIGGVVRLATKVAHELSDEQTDENAPNVLSKQAINAIFEVFEKDQNRVARLVIQLDASRIHTFIPGCVIIREMMNYSGLERLLVSTNGVREGFVYSKLLA